jgi:hypothetical protein
VLISSVRFSLLFRKIGAGGRLSTGMHKESGKRWPLFFTHGFGYVSRRTLGGVAFLVESFREETVWLRSGGQM